MLTARRFKNTVGCATFLLATTAGLAQKIQPRPKMPQEGVPQIILSVPAPLNDLDHIRQLEAYDFGNPGLKSVTLFETPGCGRDACYDLFKEDKPIKGAYILLREGKGYRLTAVMTQNLPNQIANPDHMDEFDKILKFSRDAVKAWQKAGKPYPSTHEASDIWDILSEKNIEPNNPYPYRVMLQMDDVPVNLIVYDAYYNNPELDNAVKEYEAAKKKAPPKYHTPPKKHAQKQAIPQ